MITNLIKCNICGCEFTPIAEEHYTARDNGVTGIATVIRDGEVKLYDAFDCPVCGCQVIAQERKREHVVCMQLDIEEECCE